MKASTHTQLFSLLCSIVSFSSLLFHYRCYVGCRKACLATAPGLERVDVSESVQICLHSRGRMEVKFSPSTEPRVSLLSVWECFSGIDFRYESKEDPLSVGI